MKRTLKEDDMWPYIRRYIIKEHGVYENFVRRMENSSGWEGAFHRIDVLSFPWLRSESPYLTDKEWYEYWVRKSDKWKSFCTGKEVKTTISAIP